MIQLSSYFDTYRSLSQISNVTDLMSIRQLDQKLCPFCRRVVCMTCEQKMSSLCPSVEQHQVWVQNDTPHDQTRRLFIDFQKYLFCPRSFSYLQKSSECILTLILCFKPLLTTVFSFKSCFKIGREEKNSFGSLLGIPIVLFIWSNLAQ